MGEHMALGATELSVFSGQLVSQIEGLRRAVEAVLDDCDLPDGWSWWDWHEFAPEKPRGVVQVLAVEQYYELQKVEDRLFEALEDSIFIYEWETHFEVGFYIDEHRAPDLHKFAAEQAELTWVRSLISPDFAAVHREVFDVFGRRENAIQSLHWREFEELVAGCFEAQGMTVLLGPGRADGGIDLRLTRHEVFGDVLTAVQVKSGRTPIRLHYIQALAAASTVDGSHESLFVTSSRYLPGASDFAKAWTATTGHQYQLATSSDVSEWAKAAQERLWLPNHVLRDPLPQGSGPDVGKVLMSTSTRLVINTFGLVVRQTPSSVLMQILDTRIVDGDRQLGREVPVIPTEFQTASGHSYLAAQKDQLRGDLWFATDGELYRRWNGSAVHFDWMD